MAVITTGSHPKLLWPGIHRTFMADYNKHQKRCDQIFDVFTSDKAYEEDVAIAPFGLAPMKSEGGSVTYDSHSQQGSKRYTHTVFGLGYKVTREEHDDNLYLKRSTERSAMLRDSMIQTEEIVCANVFNNAFDSNYTGFDGQALISDAHPTVDAGNQANRDTTYKDFSEAALEDMLILIENARDSRGKRMQLQAQQLIVPPNTMFDARRILGSNQQSGTANNDTNAMRDMGFFTNGALVWHYLSDTDSWFVKTNVSKGRGLKKFNRRSLDFTEDKDFDTENYCYKATMRFSASWSDWHCLYGSQGAA